MQFCLLSSHDVMMLLLSCSISVAQFSTASGSVMLYFLHCVVLLYVSCGHNISVNGVVKQKCSQNSSWPRDFSMSVQIQGAVLFDPGCFLLSSQSLQHLIQG
jgi:hypothetical protein